MLRLVIDGTINITLLFLFLYIVESTHVFN